MRKIAGVLLALTMVVGVLGCSSNQDELVIYSGRSQALVDGLVDKYQEQSDIPVRVKYGKDAELLSVLQEEGSQSPADVFWANTTGALENAVKNDRFDQLSESITSKAERFVPSHQKWMPVTTRFRVLAYNSDRVNPEDLPDSVLGLPDQSQLEGRIGWTPTYSSFQDFVTMLRLREGEDAAARWLNGISELNPKSYTSNTPMIRALSAGEIDVALTNHYYVHRLKHGGAEGEYEGHEEEEEEHGEEEEESVRPSAPVETYHFADGDPGNLALVTGAGVLSSSNQDEEARQFLEFLVSEQSQSYAANQVHEYPVIPGTDVPDYMLPVDEALSLSPEFEPGRLSELEPTLELLRNQGII